MFFRRKKHEIAGETLEELLETAGLADRVDAVRAEELPAVWLKTQPASDAVLPIGNSKFGGGPDMPEGTAWPRGPERPLMFLAQIRLADLVGLDAARELPESGQLLFFYDEAQPWGYSPEHAAGWRVVHIDSPRLTRCNAPRDGTSLPVFRVEPAHKTTIPDVLSLEAEELVLSNAELDDFADMSEVYARRFPGPEHQMFGHPALVQGDMRLECALVAHGFDCGDGSVFQTEAAEELLNEASAWRLLLQLDSDEDAGFLWGDAGLLYFWIHEDDLAAGDFSKVRVILQCS